MGTSSKLEKSKLEKLAVRAKPWRFLSSRSAWLGYELGLYRSVLEHSLYLPTWQMSVVKRLAQSKRVIDSNDGNNSHQIKQLLKKITNKKNSRYIIQETAKIYPQIIIEFLEKNREFFVKDNYYIGLYLALCDRYQHNPVENTQTLLEKIDGDEYCFLKSNLFTQCGIKKLQLLNQVLLQNELQSIDFINYDKLFFLDNFTAIKNNHSCLNSSSNQVSILVTTYNAQDTLAFCLNSLLKQTWQNLQLIVVDDASDDDTRQIIQNFVKQDSRVLGIVLPKNVGTFVAKSIGAMYATGEFLTCQDSDDWAHPQKIAQQVLPLINNPELIATTSHWLRIDEQGNYYARHYYPFLRHNPASPLFRCERVIKDMGLWHLVRTGADSEFFERLKVVYGEKSIYAIKQPLTLASHRHNSLMTSQEYGAYHKKSALDRLDYWESWRLWHIDTLSKKQKLIMPSIKEQLDNFIFAVPDKLVVNADDIRHNLKHLTLIKSET